METKVIPFFNFYVEMSRSGEKKDSKDIVCCAD